MTELGVIKVSETETTEIMASSARLHITVEEQNFIFGNAVLEKSEEVKRLVTEIKKFDIEDKDITVKNIYFDIESGLFSKSSVGKYKIAIAIDDLQNLSDILGIIAIQKTVRLDRLEWIFTQENEQKIELSKNAIVKAEKKARAMVEAIGFKIAGIKSCWDSIDFPAEAIEVNFNNMYGSGDSERRRRVTTPQVDIGTDFKATKEISATVTVEFTIDRI
jgi:uncharacterized protein YggE